MKRRHHGNTAFKFLVTAAALGGLWLSFMPPEAGSVSLRQFSDYFLTQPKPSSSPRKATQSTVSKPLIAQPAALAVGADGTVYIAESNARIWRVQDGLTSLYAELPDLQSVKRLAVDSLGRLYIATTRPGRVWRLDTDLSLHPFAGGGNGLKQLTATPDQLNLNSISGMVLGDDRTLYLVSGGKLIGIYQGSTAKYLNHDAEHPDAGYFYMGDRGGGVQKQVPLMTMRPSGGLAIDADGQMYINSNGGIFQVVGTTGARLVSQGRAFHYSGDICAESRNGLLIAERSELVRLDTGSGESRTVHADPAWEISDVETDGRNIYVLDRDHRRIFRIHPDGQVSAFPEPE